MAQASSKRKYGLGGTERLKHAVKDVHLLLWMLLSLFLLLALLSFHAGDPGWSHIGENQNLVNRGGSVGAFLSDLILTLSGYPGYSAALIVAWLGWCLCSSAYRPFSRLPGFGIRLLGLLLLLLSACALADIYFPPGEYLPMGARSGGILGASLTDGLLKPLGLNGYTLLMLALFIAGFTLYSGISWLGAMDQIGALSFRIGRWTVASGETALRQGRAFWQRMRHRHDQEWLAQRHRERRVSDRLPSIGESAMPALEDRVPTVEPGSAHQGPDRKAEVLPVATAEPWAEPAVPATASVPAPVPTMEPAMPATAPVLAMEPAESGPALETVGNFALDAAARDEPGATEAEPGDPAPIASAAPAPGIGIATRAADAAGSAAASGHAPADGLATNGLEPDRNGQTAAPTVAGNAGPGAKPARQADASAGSALPNLNLLSRPVSSGGRYSNEILQDIARQVETKLSDFGIMVEVVAIQAGPVVTRLELQPAPGVKGGQISNLSRDLARSLSMTSVRVVEVIPGKSVLGLELPNQQREIVSLREVLGSRSFAGSHSPLPLALGKDIGGNAVCMELDRMPHLLVAGTTGSGKSIALNAMLISILYRSKASQVRLILIDPKMLELSVYEGIPHLLAPVVTDMKQAGNALRWCVEEMERRYRLMSLLGVRNIASLNQRLEKARADGRPMLDPSPAGAGGAPEELEELPYIVVIIDELADMMMVTSKQQEELIARLAQKARASGIHLILATQRPSVDVITGLIKANIPARIAFQVSSRIDSRTILDQMGAENLLGQGDMLFLPPGSSVPMRVHGAFVEDDEVHRVVQALRSETGTDYREDVLLGGTVVGKGAENSFSNGPEEEDELYDDAVLIVQESRRASISYMQRRLKIGYNRAARLMEQMEQQGVVGPLESNGNREVLLPPVAPSPGP